MRSVSITVRLPFPLHEALRNACDDEYDHIHACVIGACINFVQGRRAAKWISKIANAKPKQQDYLLDKMLSFPIGSADDMVEFLKKTDRK